jgi:hypothetical protein
MAPFLVGHPALFSNWILARETALARVRAIAAAVPQKQDRFRTLLDRAIGHVGEWVTEDEEQAARIDCLAEELESLRELAAPGGMLMTRAQPWDALARELEKDGSLEASELINSLLIELYPELVDELEATTGSTEREAIDPSMSLAALRALIEQRYGWALAIDYGPHFFWYRSAEKDEPRLGERFNEPGAELELPIGIGRMAAGLHRAIAELPESRQRISVGEFLLAHPQWRGILRRIQSLAGLPYAEIQDNLLGADCLPVDLLRCKLSIFGAAKFDPKSDRWTRITLFQGAPSIDELRRPGADDWAFPCFAG